MSKQKVDFEIEEFSDQELDDLWNELESYSVEFPTQAEIQETIHAVQAYVPAKKSTHYYKRLTSLISHSLTEVPFFRTSFWMMSLFLFVIGIFVAFSVHEESLFFYLFFLMPVPFMVGLLEVLKGRDDNVIEIEMSCKFSIAEILLSRLMVIGVYNVLFNTIISVIISTRMNMPVWNLILMWFIPFTIAAGFILWLTMKMRSMYATLVSLSIWIVLNVIMMNYPQLANIFVGLSALTYALILCSGILFLARQTYQFLHNDFLNEERGIFQ